MYGQNSKAGIKSVKDCNGPFILWNHFLDQEILKLLAGLFAGNYDENNLYRHFCYDYESFFRAFAFFTLNYLRFHR